MATKRAAPLDFAAKYMEFGGSKRQLQHFYTAGRTAVDRWIEEVIDDSAPKTYELADLPKGRPAEMIVERGMDPAEFRVSSVSVNEWEMNGDLQRQTKLTIVPVKDQEFLVPVRTEGYVPPKPKPRAKSQKSTLYVVTGDEQEPFSDPGVHKSLLNWLGEVQPDEGVNLGDALDWPSVSKYRKRPETNATVKECMEALWRNICDRRTASPNTRWRMMAGNHEDRLNNYVLDRAMDLHGLTRVGDDQEILTTEFLMRFDELGIEYVWDYPNGRIQLAPDLAVRHGWIVKKGAGASALGTLEKTNYSVIIGHVHRQGITALTVDGINSEPTTRYAAEAGCMCIVKGGLGHTTAPDWQQGFLTVQVHDDGTWLIEPAVFQNGKIHWRGDRW
jgi:hypothetical protein